MRQRGKDGASEALWFQSPPSTNINTRFEPLLLEIALDAKRRGEDMASSPSPKAIAQIRVTGERSGNADGSSVERAT